MQMAAMTLPKLDLTGFMLTYLTSMKMLQVRMSFEGSLHSELGRPWRDLITGITHVTFPASSPRRDQLKPAEPQRIWGMLDAAQLSFPLQRHDDAKDCQEDNGNKPDLITEHKNTSTIIHGTATKTPHQFRSEPIAQNAHRSVKVNAYQRPHG